jgi:hypothetical protein
LNATQQERDRGIGGMLETWRLMERLLSLQKRKRAFEGGLVQMNKSTAVRPPDAGRRGDCGR